MALKTNWVDRNAGEAATANNTQSAASKNAEAVELNTTTTTANTAAANASAAVTTANGRYAKPGNGIPKSDLDIANQTSLGKADSAYQKPGPGIPKADLVAAVQTSLGKADTALQTVTSANISDFVEAVQDAVAALLAQGTNVTLSYNDAANSLTISSSAGTGGGGGGGLDAEAVRDTIGIALLGIGNINVVVNDAADTITITTTATANSTDAALRDRGMHTGQQDWATTISGKPSTYPPTIGSTGTTAVAGNDSRLTDTRTPSPTSITTSMVAPATLVTAAEGLASSDNDTSWPTTAAVRAAIAASSGGGGGSSDPAPYTAILPAITANSTVTIPHSMNTLNLLPPLLFRTYIQNGQTAREIINVTKWGITDFNNAYIEFVDAWAANTLSIIWNGKAMPAAWDTTVPGAATLTQGTVTQTTVPLTISHGVDAGVGTAFTNLYRNNTGTGTPIAVIPVGTTTYTDTGRTGGTLYQYSARTVDFNGNVSTTLSNVISATTSAGIVVPTFDSYAEAPQTTAGGSISPSWSHGTVGGNPATNLGIIAVPCTNSGAQSGVPSGTPTATLGGVNLPFLGYKLMGDNAPQAGFIAVFAGLGVPAGTPLTAAVSMNSSAVFNNTVPVSFVYQGVGSIGALVSSNAISAAPVLTIPSASGRRAWGMFANYTNLAYSAHTFTVRRGQTALQPGYTSGDMAAATSTNFAATQSASLHWAGVGFEMLPV